MGLIATKSESVLAPVILADSQRMENIAGELARCEYTLSNCSKRLGVFPRLGVNFWPAAQKGCRRRTIESIPVGTLCRRK